MRSIERNEPGIEAKGDRSECASGGVFWDLVRASIAKQRLLHSRIDLVCRLIIVDGI